MMAWDGATVGPTAGAVFVRVPGKDLPGGGAVDGIVVCP